MNIVAAQASFLPAMIDKAAADLQSARTSAEVLEARDSAAAAYDAAKRQARLQKAKGAHDNLVAAAHRFQARALEIEAQAKLRLADEYDAAQERGEIAKAGRPNFSQPEKLSGPEIIPPNELHDARLIRDAERADPGIVRRTLNAAVGAGEEPTRAKVKRAVKAKSKRKRHPKPKFEKPSESQHDRDLRMLLGVWDAVCESAREEFLQTINK